ncbi:MAG TPA: hypothetical protein VF945_21985, partial [Polyangia bacterium]
SILWKQIPPALESLMLRLLAKRPDERATLSEVRATLRALRPTATPALQRIDAAPPPLPPPPRGRHAMRLAVVVVSFVMLALAVYRPAQLRAQRQRAAASSARLSGYARTFQPPPPAAAATATAPSPTQSPRIGAALPASSARRREPVARHVQKFGRDGNYLLDPFTP